MVEACVLIHFPVSQPSPVNGFPPHIFPCLAVILSLLVITIILHGFHSEDMLSDIARPLLSPSLMAKTRSCLANSWSRRLISTATAFVFPSTGPVGC